jgi:FKBP-type peptidyl-prolyl cis-trans isomerase 2
MRAIISSSAGVLVVGLLFWAVSASSQESKETLVIANGSQVSLEYTLTTDDGNVADTNVGGDPLVYQHGGQQILPALEQELTGMTVGDEKEVSLSAEQGYGVRDPQLVQTVPTSAVPEEAREVGARLLVQAPDGQRRIVHVKDVGEDEIVLDLNHPLAGEALHFAVKVLAIE